MVGVVGTTIYSCDCSKDRLNLAKIGITALIDEATGYQDVRPLDELRKKYEELKD